MASKTIDQWTWVLSCEHADRQIPARWRRCFADAQTALASHRGWDPGAWVLARNAAKQCRVVLHSCRFSRLLIEPNRSPHHPRLFSEFTRCLPATDRRWLIENLYQPHRETVSSAVREGLQDGPGHVVHVGFHTFTPTLDGQLRNADVAWLYDPSRPAERAWCDRWREALAARRPDLRLRRNYPYRGQSDGLTSSLRAAFGRRYLGIELEVNQTWPLDHPARWQPLQRDLIESMPRPTAP